MRFLLALFLVFALAACSPKKDQEPSAALPSANKFGDPVMQKIHDLKDRRLTKELYPLLHHEEAKYRAEAAFALSSVGDSISFLELNARYLIEESAVVQQNIALGLYGCDYPIDSLQAKELYAKALNSEIRQTLLRAFGRRGHHLGALIRHKAQEAEGDKAIALGAVMGFYEQLGTWQIAEPYMVETVVHALSTSEHEELRIHSAAYLARLKRIPAVDLTSYKAQLYALLGAETNPLVKMNLVTSLALVRDSMNANVIHDELIKEGQDYRVLVSLFQTADTIAFKLIQPIASQFLSSENEHVQIAVSAYLLKYASKELHDFYKEQMIQTSHWKARNCLAGAIIKTSGKGEQEDLFEWMEGLLSETPEAFGRADLYSLYGLHTKRADFLMDFIEKETSTTAKTYAIDAWMKRVGRAKSWEDADRLFLNEVLLKDMLASNDAFRVYTVASNLNGYSDNFLAETKLPDLREFCQQWKLPQYYETRLELEKLHLRGEGTSAKGFQLENPYNHPVNWEYVASLGTAQQMVLHTVKGRVTIDMCLENAPASVAYFLELAESGFYDGLNFHRVLSNFVVQGGDPDGNGTGSSPYSLRSEFGWEQYSEGTVGIASAGKDTESCQFFITHNHTPHLSGRYTIIGRVSDGMDVVHQLMVGDVIERVEVFRQ